MGKTGFGVGTLILVKDNLVILSDQGSLTIAKANAQKFVELESFQILSGKNNWTLRLTQMEECTAEVAKANGCV